MGANSRLKYCYIETKYTINLIKIMAQTANQHWIFNSFSRDDRAG